MAPRSSIYEFVPFECQREGVDLLSRLSAEPVIRPRVPREPVGFGRDSKQLVRQLNGKNALGCRRRARQTGNSMTRIALRSFIAVLAFAPGMAAAHTGVGDASGFVYGFSHPIGGLDHVLVMVAVGLFAFHLGGRALWLVPASFVTAMALAAAAGATELGIPAVETGIGVSVVVLGLSVALRLRPPTAAAMALTAFFAIFHGDAHGAEMPATVPGFAYGAGFASATVLLHAAGIALGFLLGRLAEPRRRRVMQAGGAVMSLAGIAILTRLI
jgi:urease accessory protein